MPFLIKDSRKEENNDEGTFKKVPRGKNRKKG